MHICMHMHVLATINTIVACSSSFNVFVCLFSVLLLCSLFMSFVCFFLSLFPGDYILIYGMHIYKEYLRWNHQ